MNSKYEPYNTNDFYEILIAMNHFQYDSTVEKLKFEYLFDDDNLKKLRKDYRLDEIAGTGNSFKKMVTLMTWVNDTLIGDGNCYPMRPLNALNALDLTKREEALSNCYVYSVVLNEVFLSMGYYSRMVRCMPIDLFFQDCHCVTVAYVDDYKKWVVFDAPNRAYYLNRQMIPMDIMTFREFLIKNEPVYIPKASRDFIQNICDYWIKNMIRFECSAVSCFGAEDMANKIICCLQPLTIPVSDKIIEGNNHRTEYIHTHNPSVFWEMPKESGN